MSKHSPNDSGYKQMFFINKFEKDIMENSLSKMREQKNISDEISNPVKNISKSTQTEEAINEFKEELNFFQDNYLYYATSKIVKKFCGKKLHGKK